MPAITNTTEQPDLESSTDAYARRFAGAVGEYFLKVQSDIVRDLLPPPENCRVLDVGGGHAQLAVPLVRHGYDVTVFGSDDTCVKRLDREVGAGNYKFLTGDLLSLPVESNSFNVVLAFRLLPHLNNWQRFVNELSRVSSNTVIVDYPDLRSVNWFANHMFAAKSAIEENTRSYRCFSRDEVIESFKKNNLKAFDLRGQFLFPMAIHRLMRTATISRTIEGLARMVGLTKLLGSPVILKASFEM